MIALTRALEQQAETCGNMGSPFMQRLLSALAATWPADTGLASACARYEGDIGPAGHSLPLRIAGGLHALRLQDQADLAPIYPPHAPQQPEFETRLLAALHSHDAFLTDWITSPPQTNEIRRSAALIAAAGWVTKRLPRPIWLSELGASGGLNLMWDRYAVETPDWRIGPQDAVVTLRPAWTGPRPESGRLDIVDRRGVDLSPLDPTRASDLLRMKAYLWPDQPERLAMTQAAAGAVPAPVDAGDAIDWLEQRLASAPDGHLHIVQNTVAWQYFPATAQARGRKLLSTAGARATHDTPLAWVQLETDGDVNGLGGAALSVQFWPGGEVVHLGRADFHGRWIRWAAPSAS